MKNLGTSKNKAGFFKHLLINGICFGLVILLVVILFVLNNKKIATVDVVRVKNDIYVNNLITENMLEPYPLSQVEYTNSKNQYLTWDNHEECINKYASVATKSNGYIYKGDYNDSKPIKNAWLTTVPEDELIVTLPYDYSIFGNILTPGDHLKVNATYEVETGGIDVVTGSRTKSLKAETLFNDLKVIDMLNGSGNSIYDYYTDLLNMPLAEREATLRDESFITNVSPKSLVFSVKDGEAFNRYCIIKNQSGVNYDYGLYPRTDNDDILEQFQDLTRQITAAQSATDRARALREG